MLVFLGLRDEGESWERIGKVANGRVIEDPTDELEVTVKDVHNLEDEENLRRIFDNHYINAIPVRDEGERG